MRVLWLDFETGGLDACYHEPLTVAGIIEVDKKVAHEFYFKIKPNFPERLQVGALKINKLKKEDVMQFSDSKIVFNDLKALFIKYGLRDNKLVLAGHNVGFDRGFLDALFDYHGCRTLYYWLDYHSLDTMSVAAWLRYCGLLNVDNLRLTTLCEHFGIALNAHDALEDINATKKLAVELYKMLGKINNGE